MPFGLCSVGADAGRLEHVFVRKLRIADSRRFNVRMAGASHRIVVSPIVRHDDEYMSCGHIAIEALRFV